MSIQCDYLVIGTGSIAKRHVDNLKDIFGSKIIGIASGTERKIDSGKYNADLVFRSISEAIINKPKFAIIATPSNFHLENAIECLTANIPILIEKPLSNNLENLKAEKRFFLDKRNIIEVGYCLRYLPAAQMFRKIIKEDSHGLGEVLSVISEVGEYLPNWRPERDYRTSVSAQEELGGGVLLELSHEIDYLNWIFGDFDKVFCSSRNSNTLEINVEDLADVLLIKDNGLTINLHLDFIQSSPVRKCKAICHRGTLTWNILRNSITIINSEGSQEILFLDEDYDFNEMYIEMLKSLERLSNSKKQPSVTLEDSAKVLSIISSMKKSSKHKKIVNLNKSFL